MSKRKTGFDVVDRGEEGLFKSPYSEPRNIRGSFRLNQSLDDWMKAETCRTGESKNDLIILALEMLKRSRTTQSD
ncbi:hypothetical protein [Okeania sp. SIO2B3]|uniref:hypothetical protein n=1 Tax=Okeania sp. SIO2B3 TaxID=2607784 RepID=UPI0013BF44B6|nr:hypothetical protein [Okeania sp. SIO2B3]NET44750.1 hypothetical protein [Okeania sp. SIO2B3]